MAAMRLLRTTLSMALPAGGLTTLTGIGMMIFVKYFTQYFALFHP
jgi:hypothetical protein